MFVSLMTGHVTRPSPANLYCVAVTVLDGFESNSNILQTALIMYRERFYEMFKEYMKNLDERESIVKRCLYVHCCIKLLYDKS